MRIYLKLYHDIMDSMMRYGVVKAISISLDLYEQLSEDDRYNIESLLQVNSRIKWIICVNRQKYYNLLYMSQPDLENNNEKERPIT
jgi:hypothetical protein